MDKESLIASLQEDGYLKTPSIIEAFNAVDRKDFVPESDAALAYENVPLPIGYGQTISQPLTVAFIMELLEPRKGDNILDVGSGSGWQAAILAFLVRDEELKAGRVTAIERIPELKSLTEKNVAKYEDLNKSIFVVQGDGANGYPKNAPFDKIIAAASADTVPEAWKDELKIGGRIVAPVKESIIVLNKISKDEFVQKQYFGFSFVPLIRD